MPYMFGKQGSSFRKGITKSGNLLVVRKFALNNRSVKALDIFVICRWKLEENVIAIVNVRNDV